MLSPFGFRCYGLGCGLFSVVLFFSPVRTHHIACFGLGPFLRFHVSGSSLLGPLLLFSVHLAFLVPFLGLYMWFSFHLFFRRGSLPFVFGDRLRLDWVFFESRPYSFRVRFLHDLWVLFRRLSFCSLFVCFVYPSRILFGCSFTPLLSLCLSSFSFPFSCSGRFKFLFVILFLRLPPLPLRGPCVFLFLVARCSRCSGFCGFFS